MALNYYVLDLETTGLNSTFHEVCEISIIRATDKVQLTKMVRCERPHDASFDALQMLNKTISDLKMGTAKEQVVKEVNNFLALDGADASSRCIVGHNVIKFDKRFLHEMWASAGSAFPADLYLDTMELTKQFIKLHNPEVPSLHKTASGKTSTKLHSALYLTGTPPVTSQMHTAKSDTRNTFMLWKKMVDDHKMDYLPHIKTFPHITKPTLEDITTLDMAEIE